MADKKVVIMRGTSGAGKSTYVEKNHADDVVVSADKFFIKENGDYKFDFHKIGQAHAWCFGEFVKALQDNAPVVVVDNTNIKKWEYNNYIETAKLAGYNVEIVEVVPKTPEEIQLCVDRNTHNVPAKSIQARVREFVHEEGAIEVGVSS
jgi:predicted kinase